MRKAAVVGSILFICALLATAFGQPVLAQGKDFKWPSMLKVATPGTQSSNFACTNGWGPKFQAATGVSVRVIPEDGEVRRYVRFTEGKEFDLDSVTIADTAFAMEGQSGYADKRANPVRILWHHNDTPWSFVVRGDSKIKTIQDLKQKGIRVAVASPAPPMVVCVKQALPAFLGWTPEEAAKNWTFVPAGSYAENCRSVVDGKADVSYMSPISSITYEMEAHPKKIRWLSMPLEDKAAWKRWIRIRPTTVPAEIDFGVPTVIGTDGLTSNFLYWVRPDMSAEMAYRLAKWFNEGFESYKGVHAIAPRMSLKHFRKYLKYSPFPVHEGTVRYMKEIGQWTAKDDEWNNAAIKLMDRWCKARNAALDEAKAKGVKVHWESKEYLEILKKHTAGLPPFTSRI